MNWSLGPMVDTSLLIVCVKMLTVNNNNYCNTSHTVFIFHP